VAERLGALASRRPADEVFDDRDVVVVVALTATTRSDRRPLRRNTEAGTKQ
jgi:hypothetical protein